MRIERKGKQTVVLTMTRNQYQALCAAIDSVTSIGQEDNTRGYDDVYRFEEALTSAEAKLRNATDTGEG